jgi:hypothetical protein
VAGRVSAAARRRRCRRRSPARRITARQLERAPATTAEPPARRSLLAIAGVAAALGVAAVAVAVGDSPGVPDDARTGELLPTRQVGPGTAIVDVTGARNVAVLVQTTGEPLSGSAVTGRLAQCRATGPDGRRAAMRRPQDTPLRARVAGTNYRVAYFLEPAIEGSYEIGCDGGPTSKAVGQVDPSSRAGVNAGGLFLSALLVGGAVIVARKA